MNEPEIPTKINWKKNTWAELGQSQPLIGRGRVSTDGRGRSDWSTAIVLFTKEPPHQPMSSSFQFRCLGCPFICLVFVYCLMSFHRLNVIVLFLWNSVGARPGAGARRRRAARRGLRLRRLRLRRRRRQNDAGRRQNDAGRRHHHRRRRRRRRWRRRRSLDDAGVVGVVVVVGGGGGGGQCQRRVGHGDAGASRRRRRHSGHAETSASRYRVFLFVFFAIFFGWFWLDGIERIKVTMTWHGHRFWLVDGPDQSEGRECGATRTRGIFNFAGRRQLCCADLCAAFRSFMNCVLFCLIDWFFWLKFFFCWSRLMACDSLVVRVWFPAAS